MAKNDTATQLLALAKDNAKRTKYAQFLELLEPIETALSAGVARESVRALLNQQGLPLTVETFKSFLYRARQGQKAAPNASASPTPVTNAPSVMSPPRTTNERTTPNSTPASLDPVELRAVRDANDFDDLTQLGKKGRNKK